MDFVFDFIDVGDGDAIIVWGREPNDRDSIYFIDGGGTNNGESIIKHYREHIEPHIQPTTVLGFINSHPHADHINGLVEIVDILGSKLSLGIYNDPIECITTEQREAINREKDSDTDISHLYEEFEKIKRLNEQCITYGIHRFPAYADLGKMHNGAMTIISPYKDFYVNLVQEFSNIDFLKSKNFSKSLMPIVDELTEDWLPCKVVDEINDASPENLTSTVILFTDGNGEKYLLTGDAGVDSFNYAAGEGHELNGATWVQLPHHGSRRNISSEWVKRFSPKMFLVSAAGNAKHPRRALVNCIKSNVADCKIFSTHTNGTMSYCTNKSLFPDRNWGPGTPL